MENVRVNKTNASYWTPNDPKVCLCQCPNVCLGTKFWQITQPRFAIQKTLYSGIIRGRISRRIGGYNSTRVIIDLESNTTYTFYHTLTETTVFCYEKFPVR